VDDLGGDSPGLVRWTHVFEEKLDIEIPNEETRKDSDRRDAITAVERYVPGAATSMNREEARARVDDRQGPGTGTPSSRQGGPRGGPTIRCPSNDARTGAPRAAADCAIRREPRGTGC
jgi:hypothetical protein